MNSIYIHGVKKIKVTDVYDLDGSYSMHIIISGVDSEIIFDIILFGKSRQDLQFDFFTD